MEIISSQYELCSIRNKSYIYLCMNFCPIHAAVVAEIYNMEYTLTVPQPALVTVAKRQTKLIA
jgi:hypothetical protein